MKVIPPYRFWIVDDDYEDIIVDSNTLIIRSYNYNIVDLWLELHKNSEKFLKSSNSLFVKYVKRETVLNLELKQFNEQEKKLNIKKYSVLKKLDKLNNNLKREIQLNDILFSSIIKGEKNGK
ncbi:MAG: hypothetical protein ACRDAW_01310 [Metamycoplasmataceae bacterium]